jgi:tetratricopeptide (TPR) repeat protein
VDSWSTIFLERAGRVGLEFEARFYDAVVQRTPGNTEALAELAHALTRLERFEEGLEVDRQLVRLVPENETAHYNLACSLALCRQPREALDALQTAVVLGYEDVGHLLADGDLLSLHAEPRFQELVERLRQ